MSGSRTNKTSMKRKKPNSGVILLIILIAAAAIILAVIYAEGGRNVPGTVNMPEWVKQDFLPLNEYSRPGTELKWVNGVVVHYVGNPNTTAEQNRSYFAGLAATGATSASSHFIIGMDGTVIQCVPLNEIAYCSNKRNSDTISIECCHPDETGKFTPETVESLTKLVRFLADTYRLEKDDIIRHYDVTGKICPKYYVENPDEWDALKNDIFSEKNK